MKHIEQLRSKCMERRILIAVGLAFLAVQGGQAQGFEFQYRGESLANGATVTIAAEEDSFGELSCETNPTGNPSDGLVLKMLSGSTANVNARLQITHNTLDAEMLQWCMGGTCMPFGSNTMLTKRFAADGSVQVQFDATNIRSNGYLSAVLTASVGLESHRVNIEFTNGENAGVESVVSGRPAVQVYDLNGRSVKGRLVAGVYIISDGYKIRKTIIR
jgi:hypothetical protein